MWQYKAQTIATLRLGENKNMLVKEAFMSTHHTIPVI